jgi:hypothetical protein
LQINLEPFLSCSKKWPLKSGRSSGRISER